MKNVEIIGPPDAVDAVRKEIERREKRTPKPLNEPPEYEYEDRLFPPAQIPREPHRLNVLTLQLFMDLYRQHANDGSSRDDD